jgi:transcriptional regulator with XRE-family HTH domain
MASVGDPALERRRRQGVNVIPQRVRNARVEAGLTMAELADGKVSRTAIHLIEAGRTRPTHETLAHIAARTGRTVAYFLGSDTEPLGPDPEEVTRRTIDQLRQASWSLTQLVRQDDLTEPERTALVSLLTNVRMGMRLVEAIRDERHPS